MPVTMSSRDVSLSDHVKRRRSSAALNSSNSNNNYYNRSGSGSGYVDSGSCGSGSSSNGPIRHNAPQHHNNNYIPQEQYNRHGSNQEGGYDSHAASYGNYDAPHCRSYGMSEHGCYNTENYIRTSSPQGEKDRAVILPRTGQHVRRNSDPDEELELNNYYHNNNQYSNNNIINRNRSSSSLSRQRRTSSRTRDDPNRFSQATTVAMGNNPINHHHHQHQQQQQQQLQQPILDNNTQYPTSSWDEEQSSSSYSNNYHPPSRTSIPDCSEFSSSYCPSAATVSTAGSSKSSSSSSTSGSATIIEEDIIRQGVIDISMLIATYLAGALSFIIGMLLTIFSPLIKIIKLIVGDVRGLLGDAGFIQELGSLWRVYRDLRRRSSSPNSSSPPRSPSGGTFQDMLTTRARYDSYSRDTCYYDDESTVGDQSSVFTEASPQFVGGWQPRVSSSSVGSSTNGSASAALSGNNSPNPRRTSSRSHPSLPSLPQVYEDSQYHHDKKQHAPMSSGAPLMYQQQEGNSSSAAYSSGYQRGRSYSSSPVKSSSRCPATAAVDQSYYSPIKNRRQRPGVI